MRTLRMQAKHGLAARPCPGGKATRSRKAGLGRSTYIFNFMTWTETLNELHRLQQTVKARSMIYQIESKEEAAQAFNRPLNYFYHWSYRNWSRVSKMLVCKRELVMNE